MMESILLDEGMICASCGAPGTHIRSGWQVTPTDRGEERIWVEEWYCDECDPLTLAAALDWPS